MKVPKGLKKMDARIIQILVMVAIAGCFIYLFYHQYHLFRRYQESKTGPGQHPAERSPLQAPTFFNFSPGDANEDTLTAQLFSFEKKKPEKLTPSTTMKGEGTGSDDYRILGVVKEGQLYLLVRSNTDNKIRLVAEGMDIDNRSRVKKLFSDHVIITESSGQERTYKLFPELYRYTGPGQDREKPDKNESPPRRLKADEEKRKK